MNKTLILNNEIQMNFSFSYFSNHVMLTFFFATAAEAGVAPACTKTTDLFWDIQHTWLIFTLRKLKGRLSFVARQTFALLLLLSVLVHLPILHRQTHFLQTGPK